MNEINSKMLEKLERMIEINSKMLEKLERMIEINSKMLEREDISNKINMVKIIRDNDFKEQVRILSMVGLKPKEIAAFLDKTPNHIRVTLSNIKKLDDKVNK